MKALPQPNAGEGIVFCLHQVKPDGMPTFLGGHVIKISPDQMLSPGELPHEWLIVCDACKAKKDKNPFAPIRGLHWECQEGGRIPYEIMR